MVRSVHRQLVFSLLWGSWAIGWAAFFVPERIVKGVYAFFWERRHGVLLWRGRVEEQPLGKDQFPYLVVSRSGKRRFQVLDQGFGVVLGPRLPQVS